MVYHSDKLNAVKSLLYSNNNSNKVKGVVRYPQTPQLGVTLCHGGGGQFPYILFKIQNSETDHQQRVP